MKKEENLREVLIAPDTAIFSIEKRDKWDECEFCFQFDDEEPQVFATNDIENKSDKLSQVTFTLSGTEGSSISFQHNESGKTFKLFVRELTEKGREIRNKKNY